MRCTPTSPSTRSPRPRTIFREVAQAAARAPPARGTAAQPAIERYARPRPVAPTTVGAERTSELAEELRERLRDSVRAHLVADVPVGVLLSGGIDSSVLARSGRGRELASR